MKIIPKISIVLVIVVLVIMGAVSFFTVRWTQKLFNHQIHRMMSENLDHIRLKIIEIENNIQNTAKILSQHPGLKIALILGQNRGVNRILNDLISVYPYFNYILIVEPDGSIFASSTRDNKGKENGGEQLPGINIKNDMILSENLASEMISLSPGQDPFFRIMGLEGGMSQWHVVPVLKKEKITGWIIVSYNWQYEMGAILRESATNLGKIGYTGTELYLATENGDVIAKSGGMETSTILSVENVYKEKEIHFGKTLMKLIMANKKREVYKPVREIRDLQFFIAFFGVLLLIAFLYAVMHRVILSKVKLLHTGAERYKKGDFNYELPEAGNDELGDLARTFNQMGKSLYSTLEELKKEKAEMKTFKIELNDKVQGAQNITELSQSITAFFCKFAKAHVGALYIANQKKRTLKFAGSFPLETSKEAPREIKFGHGRCGQAALDKETAVFTGQPGGYLKIETAMGAAHPVNLLIFPVILENAVIAVLEIGSFEEFSNLHMDFLSIANDTLANAITLSLSRGRIDTINRDTRAPSNDLEAWAKHFNR